MSTLLRRLAWWLRGSRKEAELREVLILTLLGLVLSVPLVRAASRFVASFLFEMQPNDFRAIALALAAFVSAAVIAGYGPARKASTIDPATALRQD